MNKLWLSFLGELSPKYNCIKYKIQLVANQSIKNNASLFDSFKTVLSAQRLSNYLKHPKYKVSFITLNTSGTVLQHALGHYRHAKVHRDIVNLDSSFSPWKS